MPLSRTRPRTHRPRGAEEPEQDTLPGTRLCDSAGMPSPQSLSESDRRLVAAWAADCAERVLPLFETEAPDEDRPRDAIARARAYARGELDGRRDSPSPRSEPCGAGGELARGQSRSVVGRTGIRCRAHGRPRVGRGRLRREGCGSCRTGCRWRGRR
ncbi:protein of unknown function [Agreia sp. COWG]|nr:protein of unknown function [Agreia sp. COWG]